MNSHARAVFFLPGNHLYPPQHLEAHRNDLIVMVEDEVVCRRWRGHQQKLALVLGAMREHAAILLDAGFEVFYCRLQENLSLTSGLEHAFAQVDSQTLYTFEITDQALQARIARWCSHRSITHLPIGDPGFMTPKAVFRSFAQNRRTLRMADFYKNQRLSQHLLVDETGAPLGGQWSFDAENRKKLPRTQAAPALPQVVHSDQTRAVITEVAERFADHPGHAHELWLPTTRAGAINWLEVFLRERLIGFGTYEDAITHRSVTLFHSTLSPLINLGLILPEEVVTNVMQYAADHTIPINDLEGFLRQLIGWREFIRGVYVEHGAVMRALNTRNHKRMLTHHWHDGTTGIPPLDDAIRHQLEWGWTHHINRLMVIANLMNLCEIVPTEVHAYFMQYYLDAFDWVMVPNVYGMGLNSEGGIFATKPYICGSNYLLKMSDFSRGDWCDAVDGLYWRFIANHFETLRKNPRLAMLTAGLNKMPGEKKQRLFSAADGFLARCTA